VHHPLLPPILDPRLSPARHKVKGKCNFQHKQKFMARQQQYPWSVQQPGCCSQDAEVAIKEALAILGGREKRLKRRKVQNMNVNIKKVSRRTN